MKNNYLTLCLLTFLSTTYSIAQNFVNTSNIDNLYAQDLFSIDIDADDDNDILYIGTTGSGSEFRILLNDGCGNFTSKSHSIGSFTPTSLGVGDLNGDSKPDIVINAISSGVGITFAYINDGNGNYTSVGQQISSLIGKVKVDDLDGQNGPDLIITGKENGINTEIPKIKVFLNNGSGTFAESVSSEISDFEVSQIEVGNIDQDADTDFLVRNPNGIFLFKNNGNAIFTQETLNSLKGGASKLVFADFNNDNYLDLITSGLETGQKYTDLHLNDGSGLFTTQSQSPFNDFRASEILPLDIDNDNDQDLIFRGSDQNNALIEKIFKNNGNGVFTPIEDETLNLLTGNLYTIDSKGNGIQNVLSSTFTFNGFSFSTSLNLIENIGPVTLYLNECSSYTWIDGQTYTHSTYTSYTMTGGGFNGCDSTAYLDLTILPTYVSTDYVITSESSFTWIDGNTYTASSSNAASFFILNSSGTCQDEVILDLKLNEDGVNQEDEPEFKWVQQVEETSDNLNCAWPFTIHSANLTNGDFIIYSRGPNNTSNGTCPVFIGGQEVSNVDGFIARISKGGQLIWAKSDAEIGGPVSKLSTDANNNIFCYQSLSTSHRITKLGSDGGHLTTFNLQGIHAFVKDMSVENNSIYLVGRLNKFGSDPVILGLPDPVANDAFIVKLNANSGATEFAGSIEGNGSSDISSITFDGQGNIYVGGEFNFLNDFDFGAGSQILDAPLGFDLPDFDESGTVFMAKYNSTFALQWVKPFRSSGNSVQRVIGLKKDPTSNSLYLAGEYRSTIDLDPSSNNSNFNTNSKLNFFFAKYELNGDLIWGKDYGENDNDHLDAIDIDESGNLLIGGSTNVRSTTHPTNSNWTIAKADIEIQKYKANDGVLMWQKNFTSDFSQNQNDDRNSIRSLWSTSNGGFTAIGTFSRTMDFDDGVGYASKTFNSANGDGFSGHDLFFMSYGNISPCSENLVLTSPANDITIGTIELEANDTSGYINAENKLSNGTRTTYRSGRYIKLEPGFIANTGAIFKTEFGGCQE
ncbi:Repeat domain-containing protein [Spirosomataceae bacterium TFI 002]|nr:Repeat domain-containing protein [Spirosomataceae bacterium TFI 002]